uniref:Enoyl reductase (ER) domain-containing protein n=1 Tax=Alexandrium catenella TaxID=2925 RepID=A0A7S1RLJ4_ALECA
MAAAVVAGPLGSCQDPTFKTCDPHFERLQVAQVPLPHPGFGQALVQVEASSVNPSDWKFMFMYQGIIGKDFTGKVVASVFPCDLKAGALVWGDAVKNGGLAEYIAMDCRKLGIRPAGWTAAQAGVLPHVGLASLQALTMAGAPWQAGPTVLVLGGSGGTGHVGVQLARALGASRVVTTCSAEHEDGMRSLGVDQVIDYHTQNWWEVLTSVDVIFDTVGQDHTGEHAYAILNNGGFLVTLADGPLVLASPATAQSRPQVSQAFSALMDYPRGSLDTLKKMADDGVLKVLISKTYDLGHVLDALEASRAGHAWGKISVEVAR